MPRDTLIDVFRDLMTVRESGPSTQRWPVGSLCDPTRAEFLVYDTGYRVRSYTYGEVGRAARGFARKLGAAGLQKGDTVVFWGENRPEWLACYWGCLVSGIIVVPIDYRSSAEFVARVRTLVHARLVLIGDDVNYETGFDFAGDPERNQTRFPVWRFSDLDWHGDGPMPEVAISRDDVIQIIFTSGATAEPKGVVIRHRNVLANIIPVEREIAKYRRYARPFHPLRFLNLLPLSHMFGQSMATSIPPMVRGTVIFTRSFNPHDLLRLIRARRVSVLVCVPKILDVLREHVARTFPESTAPPQKGISIPGRWWKYRRVHSAFGVKFWAFIVGAAPLPPELEEFWRRMGFAVIQGYGLTETAPIVTLNHPFKKGKEGSVGTPIAGVEVRIADDGEILVRGENVTSGYYVDNAQIPKPNSQGPKPESQGPRPESEIPNPKSQIPSSASQIPNHKSQITHSQDGIDADGWLHTGDIGERDTEGRLFIRGRKKEMIVTPEGLNVFPEDVERTLDELPGVRESAVVGVARDGEERVHAVLVLEPGIDVNAIVRGANMRLQDHQRIRAASIWPAAALPRTEGTRKLKRAAVRAWVAAGEQPLTTAGDDTFEALVAQFAGGRDLSGATTLDDLGLSSLERVELMVALEDRFQTRIDEARFADAHSVDALKRLVEQDALSEEAEPPADFPTWNRAWPVRVVRRLSLGTWILPLARLFARTRVEGLDHLANLDGPVIFASNHQSHMDVPMILAALPGRWRAHLAPAMLKEFFTPHFHPADHTWRQWFTNSVNYYLACFYFNAFPIPQREAGARQALHYMGDLTSDGWSILIFPEGVRGATGDIKAFRGGVGMIASRLEVPVIPVRLDGLDRVLHPTWHMARPGRVRVAFGAPLRLRGEDYAKLANQVEEQVRSL